MTRSRSLTTLVAVLALAAPTTAAAKGGGGGGGGGTTSAPAEPAINCFDGSFVALDSGSVFTNQVGNAGCVTVEALSTGGLRLVLAQPNQNWRVVVNSSGTSASSKGVDVDFINKYTGYKASARIEPGKTDIRG